MVHAPCDEGPVGPRRTDEEIVEALNVSPSTVARVRKRCVVESLEAALDHKPQPARLDKVKINGAVEERLIELAYAFEQLTQARIRPQFRPTLM